jgi:hypothetical protein
MAKERKKRHNPKVSRPDLQTPRPWSYAHARRVAINPILTGIGSHPRSISDEDWVLNCERDVRKTGLAPFLADLLDILRLTIPRYLGQPPTVGEYPRRETEEDMPPPDVFCSSDGDLGDGWDEKIVGGIICNPVHAGIPPFPPTVDDKTWIAAGVKMVGNVGLRPYLVNLLYQLKKSVRAVIQ